MLSEEIATTQVLTENTIRIDVKYNPSVNYVLHQNGFPFVSNIRIDNLTDKVFSQLKISVHSEDDFLIEKILYSSLNPGDSFNFDHSKVELATINANFLLNLTERTNGKFIVSVHNDDEELSKWTSENITIIPFDHFPGFSEPRLIVAYVIPNSDPIKFFASKVSDTLRNNGFSDSLEGYQRGERGRVKEIVTAVYRTAEELNLNYCGLAPSYEKVGQKVRGADEIMESKMGNCLDLTLFFASVFENIGLNPIIFVIEGHAFVGVWFTDEKFPQDIFYDNYKILNLIEQGDLCAFESTGITVNTNFNEAVVIAKNNLRDVDKFYFAADVVSSRSSVLPLPNRSIADGKWVVEREEKKSNTNVDGFVKKRYGIYETEKNSTKFDIWKKKLLDISLRNSLINMKNTKKVRPIMTHDNNIFLRALEGGTTFNLNEMPSEWRSLVNKSASPFVSSEYLTEQIKFIISESSKNQIYFDMTDTEFKKEIQALYRISRTELEENGSNSLYVSIGVLKWYEGSITEMARYSPLIMVPVELTRSASGDYKLSASKEEPFFNTTLIEKMGIDYELNIPFSDSLPTNNNDSIILDQVMQNMRDAVFSKEGWNVSNGASLGVFSFGSFVMWKDIDENEKLFRKNKIIDCIADTDHYFPAQNINLDSNPYDYHLTLPADSSQIRAVKAASNGMTFVLHGPPGTGKSQTITNIISNAMYNGKTVLFVAEKMAALEVVKKRLDQIGIGDNCLELHSNKTSKSIILGSLRKAVENSKNYHSNNYNENKNLDPLLRIFREFYDAMHEKGIKSLSVWDALSEYEKIDTPDLYNDKLTISLIVMHSDENKISEVRQLIDELAQITKNVDIHSEFLNKVGATIFTYSEKRRCIGIINEVRTIINSMGEVHLALSQHSPITDRSKLIDVSRYIAKYDYDVINGAHLFDFVEIFKNISSQIKSIIIFINSNVLNNRVLPFKKEEFGLILETLRDTVDDILGSKNDKFGAKPLYEIIDIGNSIHESMKDVNILFDDVSKTWKDPLPDVVDFKDLEDRWNSISVSSLFKKILGKKKFMNDVKKYLIDDNIKFDDVDSLLRLLNNLIVKFNGLRSQCDKLNNAIDSYIVEKIFYAYSSVANDQIKIMDILENNLDDVNTLYNVFNNHPDLFEKLSNNKEKYENSLSQLEDILKTNIPRELDECKDYFNDLESELDNLIIFTTWNGYKKELDDLGLSTVYDALEKGFDPKLLLTSFNKAYFKEVANEGIYTSRELYSFDSDSFENNVRKFKKIDESIRKNNQFDLKNKVTQRFMKIQNDGIYSSEVKELNRRIIQTRPRISMRNLFADISHVLMRVCPCMLMSPLSVAQYLRPDFPHFDIVIFDEASQIPTHKAIGALARANSAVIVGDPKQLPPTTFFQTKIEVDDSEEYLEDMDSFLDDSLTLSLPELHLEWHYRSKHESLIAFSNSTFYNGGMVTFPSVDDRDTKVRFEYVGGKYEKGKRTNIKEAQAIVKEILVRLKDPLQRNKSIGVVALNLAQANIIEDLLQNHFLINEHLAKYAYDCEEKLIIKNLENIQGDERDIILFSINFGPDKNGKISTNFGAINRVGGEKRLNVAVSRAREEMIVFASMKGDMIPTSTISSKGVIVLKEFLNYAECGGYFSKLDSHKNYGTRKSIAAELTSLGYDVDVGVGKSNFRVDVAIRDPNKLGKYLCGIICDAPVDSKLNIRDREFTRDDNLKRLGWDLINIKSVDWFLNKKVVVEKLKDFIKNKTPDKNDSIGEVEEDIDF